MAFSDIRYDVRAKIVAAIRNELDGVQVELGWPGDRLELESIWLGRSDGDCNIPVMKAGYKTMDDTFTVPIEIQAGKADQTRAEAEARSQVLVAAVVTILLTDPSLGSLTGVQWAVISHKVGPETVITKQGAVTFAEVELSVHAREQGNT